MSFMVFEVECSKCHKKVNTSFGMVGSSIIAETVKDCKCGGKFKRVDNKISDTELKVPFHKYNTLKEICNEMAILLKGCNSHTCSVCEICGGTIIKLLVKYKAFKGGNHVV